MNNLKNISLNSGFYVAIGQQGSGKTAFITYLAVSEYQKNKRLILTNYTLFDIPCLYYDDNVLIDLLTSDTLIETVYIPNRFKDKPYNIAQEYYNIKGLYPKSNDDYLNGSIILLDEIHVYYDSYDTFKKHPRIVSGFISQLRKRKILLLGTTQRILKIPMRMRSEVKYVLDMEEKGNLFSCVFNKMDGYYYKPFKKITIDLRNYFKYYDTNEIITP